MNEIETARDLEAAFANGSPLSGLRLQDLDLTRHEERLLTRTDLEGLVVLGGRLSPTLDNHLRLHGARSSAWSFSQATPSVGLNFTVHPCFGPALRGRSGRFLAGVRSVRDTATVHKRFQPSVVVRAACSLPLLLLAVGLVWNAVATGVLSGWLAIVGAALV